MKAKHIWIATYESFDSSVKMLKASTSLLALQTFVLNKAKKAVKILGSEYEYNRTRAGNVIYVHVQMKGDPLSPVEWFTIQRVGAL